MTLEGVVLSEWWPWSQTMWTEKQVEGEQTDGGGGWGEAA